MKWFICHWFSKKSWSQPNFVCIWVLFKVPYIFNCKASYIKDHFVTKCLAELIWSIGFTKIFLENQKVFFKSSSHETDFSSSLLPDPQSDSLNFVGWIVNYLAIFSVVTFSVVYFLIQCRTVQSTYLNQFVSFPIS